MIKNRTFCNRILILKLVECVCEGYLYMCIFMFLCMCGLVISILVFQLIWEAGSLTCYCTCQASGPVSFPGISCLCLSFQHTDIEIIDAAVLGFILHGWLLGFQLRSLHWKQALYTWRHIPSLGIVSEENPKISTNRIWSQGNKYSEVAIQRITTRL